MTAALATAPHALHRDCDSVYLLIGRAAKHPAAFGDDHLHVPFLMLYSYFLVRGLPCPQYNKCVCFSSSEWKRATIGLRAEVGSLSPLAAYRQCTIVVQDNCLLEGFRTTNIFHLLGVHVQFCRVINTFVAKELLRASLVPVGARQHRRTVRSV